MKLLNWFLCFAFVLCICKIDAQTNEKALQYIDAYKAIAMAEMKRSGVPAAITLAQGILESGCGESNLCQKSNNHFGIKCKNDWTGEKVYHDDDARGECFRKYTTAAESFQDHSNFLVSRPHYSFLFKLPPSDYEAWAKGLKKAGYATEKDYPQRLIKVINDYNLNQYTLAALQSPLGNLANAEQVQNKQDTEILGELIIPISSKKLQAAAAAAKAEQDREDSNGENTTREKQTMPVATTADTVKRVQYQYPSGIFVINQTRVMYVPKGTSLLSFAQKNNLSFGTLLNFNDLDDVEILPENQLIFIEPKPKKGAAEFHTAIAGETLYTISQHEGVRLENILEYNRLSREAVLQAGQKIYLRPTNTTADKLPKNNMAH